MTANLAFYAANRQSPEPNPDYTWTVIQYPLNQEVIVDLSPGPTLATPYGRAKVTCTNGTTTIVLDLSNLPANTPALNLYAIDPFGKGMMLGLMAISNGVAQQTFTTPLDKFMLVLSPEAPAYAPDVTVAFRSAVPEGFAVMPLTSAAGDAVGTAT